MTEASVNATRRRYGGLRGWAVAVSLLSVTAGFVLQLLGSIPGCCRVIGILPAG